MLYASVLHMLLCVYMKVRLYLFLISDNNECESQSHLCTPGGQCHNTPGGYKCVCSRGYKLDPSGTRCIGKYVRIRETLNQHPPPHHDLTKCLVYRRFRFKRVKYIIRINRLWDKLCWYMYRGGCGEKGVLFREDSL